MRNIHSMIGAALVLILFGTGCCCSVERYELAVEADAEKTPIASPPPVSFVYSESERIDAAFSDLLDQIRGNGSIKAAIIHQGGDVALEHYQKRP